MSNAGKRAKRTSEAGGVKSHSPQVALSVPPNGDEETSPVAYSQMRADMLAALHSKRHELSGTALAQALNALTKLMAADPSDGVPEPEKTVGGVISSIGTLPTYRKIEILEKWRPRIVERYERELAEIDAVLPGLRERLAAEGSGGAVTDTAVPPGVAEGVLVDENDDEGEV